MNLRPDITAKLTAPGAKRRRGGFALVVTMTMMVLLMVLAVSALSLSAISLRQSSQEDAMMEARANARMALMIAIGELQRYAGPDRAITASSDILGTPSTAVPKPNITGVWESWWDFDPNASPDYTTEKTNRFQRWLVSSPDFNSPDLSAAESIDFVNSPWPPPNGEKSTTVELVGDNTLGYDADDADKVTAGLVPISENGKVTGSYAWHVADESVKARVNVYREPLDPADASVTLADKRAMLAGHRPDPSVVKDYADNFLTYLPSDHTPVDYADALASVGKIIDLNQAELLDGANGMIKPLRNDITPYSLGLMTNVRDGGLKQDLSSVFEMADASGGGLPTEFNGEKLYASTHGITGISDPKWSALASYYNFYKKLAEPDTNPSYELDLEDDANEMVPNTYNLVPVISKVDTVFSLVGRPLEDVRWLVNKEWAPGENNNRYYLKEAWRYHDYFVNLVFTPVVTLHNPYNITISFNKMKVGFENIPVAFNFMHKSGDGGGFVSMSTVQNEFESINTMRWSNHRGGKTITMTIANWADPGGTSDNTSGPIVLKPGQTLICSPSFPPDASFMKDANGGSNVDGYDWQNEVTNDIKGAPGYISGLGYEISAVCPGSLRTSVLDSRADHPAFPPDSRGQIELFRYPMGNRVGTIGGQPYLMLRDQTKPRVDLDTFDNASPQPPRVSNSTVTDEFYVEFKMQRPGWYIDDSTTSLTEADPEFVVTAEIQPAVGEAMVECAKFEFDYEDNDTLKSVFGDREFRYPPEGGLRGSDIAPDRGTEYSEQSTWAQPFAIFSAYARSTSGGVYETGMRTESTIDSPDVNLLQGGRLAGKPFLFHNPSRTNFTLDLANQVPGVQAYELNFQPFISKGDAEDYMDVDINNRVPSLTGNESTTGIKSGSYLEIPSGPLQTIADFRRSNALATAYPPHFVQPVGNSLLHPLMSADSVKESDSSIASTELLDHSVLANHALYDRFYFSTFATRNSETPDAVFEQFMNGTVPLASQAFMPYLPDGKTVDSAKAELFASSKPRDTAYKNAAEYQMLRGPFNVNSTSVQAWKAVLASMSKSEVYTLWARNAELEPKTSTGVPITAMTLLNGGSIPSTTLDANKIDDEDTNTWNGYRELTEPQLETLAEKIVDEVRVRGPFLSMSEFVNRQVRTTVTSDPDDDAYALPLKGALEAAIAKAEINEVENATSSNSFLNQVPITEADISDTNLYSYTTPEASIGNPAAGAPGWVSQADLLRILEPSATVRGDTFVIRVYGEAQDAGGNITARAYAEAVVQRMPEYVDSADRPSVNVYTDSAASEANKAFGRRINLVSFRWLSANEI